MKMVFIFLLLLFFSGSVVAAQDDFVSITVRLRVDPRWGLIAWKGEADYPIAVILSQPFTVTVETVLKKSEVDDLFELLEHRNKDCLGCPIRITVKIDEEEVMYEFARFSELGISFDGDGNIIITPKPYF